MESKTKTNMGRDNDRIAEETESVITQVCKELKFWIHPNLRRPSVSLTYSFKFTYFCIIYIYMLCIYT